MKLNVWEIPPTKAQLDFIADMEDRGGCPKFTGKTKFEASSYISQYKESYELETTDPWAMQYI